MLTQQNQGVHLCVAALQGAGGNVSGSVARDALIKSLNKQKPDKNSPVTIEADSLDTSSPDDSMAAAKQKSCDFLVTTNLLETHADSFYLGGLSQVNIQTFFVTVAYKLSKVSNGSEMSSASFKAQDKRSEQNAIGFTMNKIAAKVTGEIRKAAATRGVIVISNELSVQEGRLFQECPFKRTVMPFLPQLHRELPARPSGCWSTPM